jgi:hypothetical protein
MKKFVAVMASLIVAGIALMQTSGDSWKRQSVDTLSQAGINISFPDGAFLGEDTLTGYQAAILLSDMLTKIDTLTGCPQQTSTSAFIFNDVPPDHWARPSLERISDLGIQEAFPDSNFKGDQFLSGYQMAYLVGKTLEVATQKADCGIQDVRGVVSRLQGDFSSLQEKVAQGTLQGPPGPAGEAGRLVLLVLLVLLAHKACLALPVRPDPLALLAPLAHKGRPVKLAQPLLPVWPAGT